MKDNETLSSLTGTLMIVSKKEESFNLTEKSLLNKIITNSYLHFIIKRALFYFLVFFIGLSLAFLIPRILPNNPIRQFYERPPCGEVCLPGFMDENYNRMLEYYAFDKSLLTQYIIFLEEFFLHGSLGPSYQRGFLDVHTIMKPYAFFTILLVIPALLISFVVGNKVGGQLAFNPSQRTKYFSNFLVFLQTVPFFWIAYILLELLIFPEVGQYPPMSLKIGNIEPQLKKILIPLIVLILANAGSFTKEMQNIISHEFKQDYVQYLKKIGISDQKIRGIVSRNAILSEFPNLNLRWSGIICQTLIVEMVLFWPGLGAFMMLLNFVGEYPLIIGTFVYIILIIVVGNFIIDIIQVILDPRTISRNRYEKGSKHSKISFLNKNF